MKATMQPPGSRRNPKDAGNAAWRSSKAFSESGACRMTLTARPVHGRLQNEYQNDEDQESRDHADGYGIGSLLHVLNDIIGEIVQLGIGHAL